MERTHLLLGLTPRTLYLVPPSEYHRCDNGGHRAVTPPVLFSFQKGISQSTEDERLRLCVDLVRIGEISSKTVRVSTCYISRGGTAPTDAAPCYIHLDIAKRLHRYPAVQSVCYNVLV